MASNEASEMRAQDYDTGLHMAFQQQMTMDTELEPVVEDIVEVVELEYHQVDESDSCEQNNSNSTLSAATLDVTGSDVTLSDLTDSFFTDSDFTASDVTVPDDADLEAQDYHGDGSKVDNPFSPDSQLQEASVPPVDSLRCPFPDFNWVDSREVWENMLKKEGTLPRNPYMLTNHPELSSRMRAMLFNWMMEVCETYVLHKETFCLAVDFTDRYLSLTRGVLRTQLQLVGVSCLFLAAKQEEIYPPKVQDFAFITDGVCTVSDILRQEMIVVKVLKWKLGPITTNVWLGVFLQMVNMNRQTDPSTGLLLPLYSNFSFVQMSRLCDLCLLDMGSLHFNYSTIAAAALFHHTQNEAVLEMLKSREVEVALCVEWMGPFTEAITEAGQSTVRSFPDVDVKEFHTLQTHNVNLDMLTHAVSLQLVQFDQEQEAPLDLTKRQTQLKLVL